MSPVRRVGLLPFVVSAFLLGVTVWAMADAAQAAAATGLDQKVGVVYRDRENRLFLDIPNNNLQKGTRVVIITLPDRSLFCCAQVGEISSAETQTIQQAIFDNGKTSTYGLKLHTENNGVRFGFGLVDSGDARSSTVLADLDGDGVEESFRDCTSREGVHLTIWSGEPLKGSRLWHAYFYLTYDTEPSCVDRDFQ